MVRRCALGTCTVGCRYPERFKGVTFKTFPNPKTNIEKCMRWIKACGRPHYQLNVDKINKNKVICSTHFVGGMGPTNRYPDPIPADGSIATATRQPLKRRRLEYHFAEQEIIDDKENVDVIEEMYTATLLYTSVGCQTDLSITEQNLTQLTILEEEDVSLKQNLKEKEKECAEL